MRKVLQTIVRDTERYSISNSSELSLSKPDLYIEKIALQGGATATTEDIVVTRSGKNLFDKSLAYLRDGYDLANCTLIATTENGWILQGNDGTTLGEGKYACGWFRPLNYAYGNKSSSIYVHQGDVLTLSADYTVLNNRSTTNAWMHIELCGEAGIKNFKLPETNVKTRITKTFTCTSEGYSYVLFTLNSSKIKIENVQVEIGSVVTEYEPYLPPKSLTFSRDYLLSLKGVNSLIDKSKFPATQTINGVTFTNNGDGTITANGTATANAIFSPIGITNPISIVSGHKFLFISCPPGGSFNNYYSDLKKVPEDESSYDFGVGVVMTTTSTTTGLRCNIRVISGYTANNLVFKPQLYDLTAIYGEGNEPTTVEQFLKDYPLSSTDKLTITKNSVKYNDTDITSEITGLDEFFSIDADVSTITTSANIALGEITEDISYSVKSNKRAVYTGEDVIYSSQTFIMSDIVTTTYNAKGKVFLTKSQFDARKAAGTLQAGTEYMIIDKG